MSYGFLVLLSFFNVPSQSLVKIATEDGSLRQIKSHLTRLTRQPEKQLKFNRLRRVRLKTPYPPWIFFILSFNALRRARSYPPLLQAHECEKSFCIPHYEYDNCLTGRGHDSWGITCEQQPDRKSKRLNSSH